MSPILQVENLTKSFGDLVLFENISFGLAEGQRVGLIAKNGSGKSTLRKVTTRERYPFAETFVWVIWNRVPRIPKN